MEIRPISFSARVKMRDIKEVTGAVAKVSAEITPGVSSGSLGLGSTTVGTLGTSASNTAGTASDVLGTAFSVHATGIDSFGIVPSSIEAITPHATPATIASSNNHPSIIGSLYSTIGANFHNMGKVKVRTKDPS